MAWLSESSRSRMAISLVQNPTRAVWASTAAIDSGVARVELRRQRRRGHETFVGWPHGDADVVQFYE